MDKIRIYIYGAGYQYNRFLSYLAAYKNRFEVLGVVTTERQEIQVLDGYPCIVATEMDVESADYIIVAIEKWEELIGYLKNLGVSEEKIIPSKVFSLPYFDLDDYLQLKKRNVTILSNTCLAGFVYRELGLTYESPTIWLLCLGEYYLEFIENYEYYLGKDMEVYEGECEYKGNPYILDNQIPKGIIDGSIIWDLRHSTNAKDAVEKWNVRRKRCNYDSVAVLMIILTDEEAIRFEKLPIRNKIGIYYKDLGLSSVVCCSEWNKLEVKMEFDFAWMNCAHDCVLSTWSKLGKINWIKFLLGKDNFIRY